MCFLLRLKGLSLNQQPAQGQGKARFVDTDDWWTFFYAVFCVCSQGYQDKLCSGIRRVQCLTYVRKGQRHILQMWTGCLLWQCWRGRKCMHRDCILLQINLYLCHILLWINKSHLILRKCEDLAVERRTLYLANLQPQGHLRPPLSCKGQQERKQNASLRLFKSLIPPTTIHKSSVTHNGRLPENDSGK